MFKKIRTLVTRYPYVTLTICGMLAGGTFSWRIPALLLPVFLVPLFYFLLTPRTTPTLKATLLLGLSFFVPFHIAVLSWFLDADISGLAGISAEMELLASSISLLIMIIVTTLAIVPLLVVFHIARKVAHDNLALFSVIIASTWVVCEWLRSLAFGAFLYGEGGSLGDYWNFGSLGLAAMDSPITPASKLIGMYGLSFLIVLLAANVYSALRTRRFKSLGIIVTVIILFTGTAILIYPQNSDQIHHGSVLQLDAIPTVGAELIDIASESSAKKSVIVLPEYSYIYEGTYTDLIRTHINDRLSESGFSITVSEGDLTRRYGTLEFHNKQGELIGTQTKELLIPTGEYLPAVLTTFYNRTGQPEVVSNFDGTRKVAKGEQPRIFKNSEISVGPVACSGILGRNIYRDLTNQGAELLTNSASLTTFNGSRAYFRQSVQMARFHAVANNRTFVQSSKGAAAFVIDESGNFIVKPTDQKTRFVDFQYSTGKNKTTYTRIGEWPLILSGLVCLIYSCFAMLKRYSFTVKPVPPQKRKNKR